MLLEESVPICQYDDRQVVRPTGYVVRMDKHVAADRMFLNDLLLCVFPDMARKHLWD